MTATVAATPPVAAESTRRWRPEWLLALVCLVHAVAPLVLVGPHFWYEWDETVYISQVSRHAPAGLFTAPRARGLPILLAPLTELTSSTVALRCYLTILSSLGLYLAFRPWLRLRPGYVVPAAAALFTTLWTAIYFGFEAMPNIFVAVGAVAVVAHFLLALREPGRRRHLVLLVAWLFFVGLMRPSDAVYLTVPLFVAALVVRPLEPRRRLLLAGCLAGGLALGWAEWVVEAYTSYGGLLSRLHAAGAENDSGIHMSLGLEARAVAGPTLCRPCTRAVPWSALWWWFLLPPLSALGLVAARARRSLLVVLLPTAAALTLLAQYVVTIDYAAPRFLLPTYALLALPVAEGGSWLLRFPASHRWTRVIAPAMALVLLAHVAVQLGVLERAIVPKQTRDRLQYLAVAANLQALGVRAPCDVVGYFAAPIAFGAGCSDVPNDFATAALRRTVAAGRTDVVVLSPHARPPLTAFYRDWPRHRAHGPHIVGHWYMYLHLAH